MGLKGKLDKLQKAMRGNMAFFELADGRRHYFDKTEAFKDSFMFFTNSMRADCRCEPRPEPPEVLRAVAAARDRGAALYSVMGGSPFLSVDEAALVGRGEFVARSLVVGRELGEPLEDLSEA